MENVQKQEEVSKNVQRSVNLTQKQEEAYKYVQSMVDNWKGTPNVLVVAGFAGTGKTTLLKVIAESFPEHPVVVTPTGKAALRVREVSGIDAETIHRYLYKHRPDGNTGDFVRTKKTVEDIRRSPCGIVFLDEGSMVDQELWEDLFEACYTTQQNIVVFGDPFQLPPVAMGKEYFSLMDPRFVATHRIEMREIMRQALENPIVRSSMLIRQGDVFEGLLDIERVMPEDVVKASIDAYASQGAVLCHTNKVRNILNQEMRARMGYMGPLTKGEPLLVVKNNYSVELYNGEIVSFEGWDQNPVERTFKDRFNDARVSVSVGRAELSDGLINPLLCVEEVMGKLDPKFQSSVAYYCGKVNDRQEMLHANLGYVLTCHKAQGSEFSNVLVCAEPTVRTNTLDGRRWLYTAITRSKESVKLCFTGNIFN